MANKSWCVNFDVKPCLGHGINQKLWLMQYQYSDDHGHIYQGDKKGAIRKNWERLGEISPGDWFVAYLKPSTFYAIGRVITPRRPKKKNDPTDTIAEYLDRKQSHRHRKGFVYYSPVFYENFSDKWELPSEYKDSEHETDVIKYPQRIDVEEWQYRVRDGVRVHRLLSVVPLKELHKAIFPISKEVLCRIRDALAGGALTEDLREIRKLKARATTKEALVNARVGQGQFRTGVLQLWGNRCSVTGSVTLEAIRASHIKPWRDSSNEERLDPRNGLPLVASLDALFDAGLISFRSSGRLIVSQKLSDSERKVFGIGNLFLRKKPAPKTAEYLAYHRQKHGFKV